MHNLQTNPDIGWDDNLSKDKLRDWQNIAKQANSSPVIKVKRFVGKQSDEYSLVAFSDSSLEIYGVVIYLVNLCDGRVSLVSSKNEKVSPIGG